MFIDMLIKSIECGIVPKSTLMKSRLNCHNQGLHSIVFAEGVGGCLHRVFLTTPDHRMHLNCDLGAMPLGLHDHWYNLSLECVHGIVVNVSVGVDPQCAEGVLLNKFQYFNPEVQTPDGNVSATINKLEVLTPDPSCNFIRLGHEQLHTIFVPEGKQAAWIVREGARAKDKDFVTLLTHQAIPECGYGNFDDVKHVLEFLKNWQNQALGG